MLMNAGIMKASSALLDDRAADGILADGVSSDSPAIAVSGASFATASASQAALGLVRPWQTLQACGLFRQEQPLPARE